jgi:hypothetical protein
MTHCTKVRLGDEPYHTAKSHSEALKTMSRPWSMHKRKPGVKTMPYNHAHLKENQKKTDAYWKEEENWTHCTKSIQEKKYSREPL